MSSEESSTQAPVEALAPAKAKKRRFYGFGAPIIRVRFVAFPFSILLLSKPS
jgi:hypothetical protein